MSILLQYQGQAIFVVRVFLSWHQHCQITTPVDFLHSVQYAFNGNMK